MGLLLFNWCGYRIVAACLEKKTETRLEAVIDEKNYDTTNLIELSVATDLPYTFDWDEWERCSGSIEVNGLHYQYVERKMVSGNMLYRCLPNTEKQTVLAARDEFFQLVSSFNHSSDNKKANTVVINNFIGDYDDVSATQYDIIPFTTTLPDNSWPVWAAPVAAIFEAIPHQPPEC